MKDDTSSIDVPEIGQRGGRVVNGLQEIRGGVACGGKRIRMEDLLDARAAQVVGNDGAPSKPRPRRKKARAIGR